MRLMAIFGILLLLLSAGYQPTNIPTGEESAVSVMDDVNRLNSMRDLDEIFALEGDNEFSIAFSSALEDWTEYGEHLEALSPEARIFYLCNAIERDVNCDGFLGYIFEHDGCYATETVVALETIGAPKTADILRRAIAFLPNGVCPTDYFEREDILFTDYDGYSSAYSELDEEFYSYPDGVLWQLNAAYARARRDSFSAPGEGAKP